MNILNKKIVPLFIAAALLLGGAVVASAAETANSGMRYQMQPYGQQLTPEQMSKAQKIYNDSYAEMEEARQALAGKRAELDQQLASPNPDRGRIEALSRDIGELRGKMLASRLDVRNKLAEQGLPPDCFGRGPANGYGPDYGPGYGPCRNGFGMGGMMEGYGNGWYHHGHGHGGWGRGGCWR